MNTVLTRSPERTLATNKLIKNTYMLLAMTLAVSCATAVFAMVTGAKPVHWILMLAVMLGMPFLINSMRNSMWSLPLTFVFTGLLGYFAGPIVGYYLNLPNGAETVAIAFGMTATIFLSLSAYALATKKDFSFLGGFLFVGFVVIIAAIVANIFLEMPVLSLAISAAVVLLVSAGILFNTSRMVNGGEDNYVMMTVSLFADIYVLFLHLLNLVSAFNE